MSLLALGGCGEYVELEDVEPDTSVSAPDGAMPGALGGAGLCAEGEGQLSVAQLDHLGWNALLARFVAPSADGLQTFMNYAALQASPEALRVLADYQALLSCVDPSSLEGTDERLAFWLNAYSATVVVGVLENWKGDSNYT